jgi:hypothetical protein
MRLATLQVILKDAILEAARLEGGEEGVVGFLRKLARDEPKAFTYLLGKVIPLQIVGDKENPLVVERVERVIVHEPARWNATPPVLAAIERRVVASLDDDDPDSPDLPAIN